MNKLNRLLIAHTDSAVLVLRQFLKHPFGFFLSMGVFAVVLSLPITLYWLTLNLQSWSKDFKANEQLTVFLKKEVTPSQVAALQQTVLADPFIAKVDVITPEQALQEFNALSGLEGAVGGENPLPFILRLTPKQWDTAALQAWRTNFEAHLWVDELVWDQSWIVRLRAWLNLLKQSVWVLSAVLGFGLLCMIALSVRSHVMTFADEIAVSKWVGATDAFVRRPFLYVGFWFGLLGSLAGLLLVSAGFLAIRPTLMQFMQSYGAPWEWVGLSWQTQLTILGSCAALGTVGAYIAVTHWLWLHRQKGQLLPF